MKELPKEFLDAFRGDLIRGSLRPPASEFLTLTRDRFLRKFVNKIDDFIVSFGQTWGGTSLWPAVKKNLLCSLLHLLRDWMW